MAVCFTLRALFIALLLCAFQPTSSHSDPCEEDPWQRTWSVNENCTVTTDTAEQLTSSTMTLFLPNLYLVALVLGLPSNLLALWVLLFRTKRQPSTILLINLTTCDLLLLTVLPFRIAYHFQGNNWTLGEPFCGLVMALFYGNMYGSMLCLALIAFDRYLALVHPLTGMTIRSRRLSAFLSMAVWAVVLVAMAPLLATKQTSPVLNLNIVTCHDVLPLEHQHSFILPYFISLFSICFVLPLAVVVFCYGCVLHTLITTSERYNHAAKVTVLVMVVCLVCLLPTNVLLIVHYSKVQQVEADMGLTTDTYYMPYVLSLAVSTFNSCLDPFIFYYVSEEFREKARQVLCCRTPIQPTTSSQKTTSTTSMSSRSKVTLLSTSGRLLVTPEPTCVKRDIV
ncbi:proteinase-activated receptor 4-like [Engraulis encrasicolus]|uniref:proteinase-activated receptor 4-like n=1 Tax=Engraulis encrasicolus TaxID=184585 RepID=UPI002FD0EA36